MGRPQSQRKRLRRPVDERIRELVLACDGAAEVLRRLPWKHGCPLLTHKQLTHRVRPSVESLDAPGTTKWAVRAQLMAPAPDGCLTFLLQLAADAEFKRFGRLLQALLRILKPSVYIDSLDGAIPYFVGHRLLSSRILELKRKGLGMNEVIRRSKRFENIRVQVQARLMELDQRRVSLRKEEKEGLDMAADRFAKHLSAGRSGRSSLIWLWGMWKQMHQVFIKRRRKKNELLERTMIGDLVAPFGHWKVFSVENRAESKMITYQTYLQERQMYTRTAMDLQNKKEDLVLDLQVSTNSCRRLHKQLEAKRRERHALHQRLLDVRPKEMKAMLSNVLDLTFQSVLTTACLTRTRLRLQFLVRDLAPLLTPEEDSPWRLVGFSGEQVLTRWANHQLAQFKLVANEVLEAMSKRNSEDVAQEGEIEWSLREIETYGDRCRMVRALKQLAHLEDDHEGVLFAVIYGAVCADGAVHPVSLWALDEKDPEEKASALCQAMRQVIPGRAKFLLTPADFAQGTLMSSLLAAIFMATPTLPCSAPHEVLGAASFAVQSAVAQEAYKERRKKGHQAEDLALIDEPPDPSHRAEDLRRRVYSWLDAAEDPNPVFDPVTHLDPAPKSIFTQIEALAGQWALEWPQDFRLLLVEGEAEAELVNLEAHELLLRWVNWHRLRAHSGFLPNLAELDLGILLELLTLLAPDVMALHSEEQRQLELAPNPSTMETATQKLVLQVAKRCSSYQILSEEVLQEEQTDMLAAFCAELMCHRAQLPVEPLSALGQHMARLSAVARQAAKTEQSQLQSFCGYLRGQPLAQSLEAMQRHHEVTEVIKSKIRSFALKMLVKRSQGSPCDMLELAQQLPKGGMRGDLISASKVQATIHREANRLSQRGDAPDPLVVGSEKVAVEELLRKHLGTLRDAFQQYARECAHVVESDAKTRIATASLEAAHVLVVTPRHLMKLFRDCRLPKLRLSALDLEEIYNEVKLQHAMTNQFEDVQRFETGLSLEMFAEVLLTMACRAQVDGLAAAAFRDKLETLIEEHLIPFSGSKQDDVVHQLLVDESLDGIIEDFTPRLRSIFVAYAGDVPVKRVAFVKVMAAPKQAMTLSLDGLAELLRHAGLQMLHRARLGRIYMELLKMRKVDDLEVDEVFQVKEEPEPLSFLEDNEGASFQYDMSFQEFLDGLIIITLFKEPNPFVSFSIRFEKFLRSLLEKLFDFANDSTEPRFRALHQALEDAFQKDVSAQGLARKLQAAED